MRSRHIGQCQVCEGDVKLEPGDVIGRHEYARPVDGPTGECPGVGAEPYDVRPLPFPRCVVGPCPLARELAARLVELKRGTVNALLSYTNCFGTEPEVITTESPRWRAELAATKNTLEAQLTTLTRDVARLARLIKTWKARELRSVDTGRTATVARVAVREKKGKAKAGTTTDVAKLAESLRKRLTIALENRRAGVIAEIFETAPRQLGELMRRPHAEAFAVLGCNHIFAAFGLDPTVAASDTQGNNKNVAVLAHMRADDSDTPKSAKPR